MKTADGEVGYKLSLNTFFKIHEKVSIECS